MVISAQNNPGKDIRNPEINLPAGHHREYSGAVFTKFKKYYQGASQTIFSGINTRHNGVIKPNTPKNTVLVSKYKSFVPNGFHPTKNNF